MAKVTIAVLVERTELHHQEVMNQLKELKYKVDKTNGQVQDNKNDIIKLEERGHTHGQMLDWVETELEKKESKRSKRSMIGNLFKIGISIPSRLLR